MQDIVHVTIHLASACWSKRGEMLQPQQQLLNGCSALGACEDWLEGQNTAVIIAAMDAWQLFPAEQGISRPAMLPEGRTTTIC